MGRAIMRPVSPSVMPTEPAIPEARSAPEPPTLIDSHVILNEVLSRPDEQRRREHKYRCAQAIIFGLPVLALQLWGPTLGANEGERWVGLFQAILAGWVMCVGATGMIVEGIIRIRHRM